MFQSEISTQLNESLHAMKAKLADKAYAWKGSWKARNAVAVLNINEGHRWKLRVYDALEFPHLTPACRHVIEQHAEEALALSVQRHEPAFQAATREHRVEKKQGMKQLAATAKRNRMTLHKDSVKE
jgi:hypothetical protein